MPLPTDPLLAQQWHLRNNTPGLLDLNVFGVWNPAQGAAYTGAGITTVVIDDGFDYTHSDLNPNYDQHLDYNFVTNTLDAFGNAADAHGTAVAGIIGAAANGSGAVGVAYDTELIGYRIADLISDAWLQDIREAIASAATSALADVANISQGIANDETSEFGVGYDAARFDEIEASIATAVNSGRGGLGMTIVKSAGNSRADNYDVNADDWTNDTRQVVVGAVDQNGFVSDYSSYGSALLVSAFGTPGEVVTPDRVGAAGYDADDFTETFNGTSAAAPMVAGIVALMYDANAGLGWRDVQSILAASARQVGSEVGAGITGDERYAWGFNAAGTWNGGGMHFSNDYGYGLVDALAAVRLAETWLLGGATAATTSNEFTNTMDVLNSATVIPDGNATGLSFVGAAGFDDLVDRVTVQMTFNTTYTGDVEIYLTSPDGTVSQLIDNAGSSNDFNGTWTFESQAFRGERAAGNWTVQVIDSFTGDTLNVSDIVIRTFGAFTSNDRYVMTNEFSDYAGLFGHATNINDTNGGTDTVNAAAVTSGSIIRLDGVAGSIDGVGVIFTNMENAIGGDAGDSITGNGGANMLYGMRGNDGINGGGGIDTMVGGDGSDTYYADLTTDVVIETNASLATGGNDLVSFIGAAGTYTLSANVERLSLGGVSAINGTGNSLANIISGNAAANVLNGLGGVDIMNGGNGSDIYFADVFNDAISEYNAVLATGGNDMVIFSGTTGTFTLGANIERLSLGGVSAINGTGNALANILSGNAATNVLNGLGGVDIMNGGNGTDIYVADVFNDSISEANAVMLTGGNDLVIYTGVAGTFTLGANIERLTLSGGAAVNGTGNALANTIIGNGASNVINGGLSNDILTGGLGADFFVFNTLPNALTNRDTITDYNVASDTIRLENTGIFTALGLATGVLNVALFKNLTTGGAVDTSDRILYNDTTGQVFYDSDGSGAAVAIQFAAITGAPTLTNLDFVVI